MAEHGAHLFAGLAVQGCPLAAFREQDADDLHLGIQILLDFGDRFRQFLQAYQSEQLRVNRDDNLIRRSKGVDGERTEGRAGVHQDVVIIRPERRQQLGKAIVLSLNQQVHLCHGQRLF